jgi:hypothetical protein
MLREKPNHQENTLTLTVKQLKMKEWKFNIPAIIAGLRVNDIYLFEAINATYSSSFAHVYKGWWQPVICQSNCRRLLVIKRNFRLSLKTIRANFKLKSIFKLLLLQSISKEFPSAGLLVLVTKPGQLRWVFTVYAGSNCILLLLFMLPIWH